MTDRRSLASRSLLHLVAVLAAAPLAGADQLVTVDNRVIELVKAREEGDNYRLTFEHGEVICPKELVKAVEIEGDMSDYVPQNDRERELLEKGHVRYKGKWLSKPAYKAELKRKAEASAKHAAEVAAHSDFADGYELETRHFEFKSNTSPEILQFYADLLESYYKLMDNRIGIKPTPTMKRTKMTVNIYKSHKDFQDANPEMGSSTLGYFWRVNNSLNFFHDYQDPGDSEWVALHECTHLLTYLIDQSYLSQIWLNEAVADYYGSATIVRGKRGKIEITPGRLQTDRVLTVQQAIEKGNDIALKDLFLITRENFHGFQYAHAWSFVYFLHQDKKREKGFRKFFKEVYTTSVPKMKAKRLDAGWGDSVGQYFQYSPEQIRDHLMARIGEDDMEALDKEWKAFVAAIPIDGKEALLKRGLRSAAWPSGESEQALKDLDTAIEMGTTDARAWWGRGWLRLWTGTGFGAGVEDFREAVKRDPLNAEFRYDLACFLTTYFGSDDGELSGSPEEQAEAAMQFGLAAAMAPKNDGYQATLRNFNELYEKAK
jgi:hypothetical protein